MKKMYIYIMLIISWCFLNFSPVAAEYSSSCYQYSDPDRPVITQPEILTPWEEAERYHTGQQPVFYQDQQFKDLVNTIPQVGPGQLCNTGQDQILLYLDQQKEAGNPLVEGYSWGPVKMEGGSGHFAVAIFKTPADGNYREAAKQGVIIEQTNWRSDWTGYYMTRSWGQMGKIRHGMEAVEQVPLKVEKNKALITMPHIGLMVIKPSPSTEKCVAPSGEETNPPISADDEEEINTESSDSYDPNIKIGTHGYDQAHFIASGEGITYAIYFENDATLATAPAQRVIVQDRLDTNYLDLNTFRFEGLTMGGKFILLEPGSTNFSKLVDLRPEKNMLVQIDGSLDLVQGIVMWIFTSINPTTGNLPDWDGFLPPNTQPPNGEGSVLYTAMPKATLTSGTEIGAGKTATIWFDDNDPIETDVWINTLDATPPTSHVSHIVALPNMQIEIHLEGNDDNSGVKDYFIFVSRNNSTFTRWPTPVIDTPTVFTAIPGNSYAFFSMARDNVGNFEAVKIQAEACAAWGDLNNDCSVDRSDVAVITAHRNQPASECPACDIDGDGKITVLDARKLLLMCTCPRCVCPD